MMTLTNMAARASGLACALLLAACSDAPAPAPGGPDASARDVPRPDAARDGAPDVTPRCPARTHEVSPGVCDATLTFAESTELPVARDHHGTVLVESAAGPRLVVLGGAVLPAGASSQSVTNTVFVAPVMADGSVGAWAAGAPLPGARAGMAVGVIGDRILAVAGRNAQGFLRTSTLAQVMPDGTLGAWSAGPQLPDGRFHLSGAVSGRWLFVSGGLALRSADTTEARPEVWSARLGDEGALGAWQPCTPLPEPISHHASFVHGGHLFVAGGLGGDPFNDRSLNRLNVYRARIQDADGTLGAWEVVNQVPGQVTTHAAALHHDRVYLFGGVVNNRSNSDQIVRAQLLPGGALGAWETWDTSLPAVRAHLHQVPARDGRAYFVSGSMEPHTPVPTTWVGTFE